MTVINQDRWLKSCHGLSRDEYEAILESQDHRCASCESPFGDKKPHVDHCHETERIRGALCYQCNVALGLLHDDAERIAQLASYVESPPFAIPRVSKRKDRSMYRDSRRERA